MLSNTATPKYYAEFRRKVIAGEIPVNREIAMEMARIDALIDNPGVYYDDEKVEGFIKYCEKELTLTDGSDVEMLESFKVWGEQIFGWYYYEDRSVYKPYGDRPGGHFVRIKLKRRLIKKFYLIVARGAAKSMFLSFVQNYLLVMDPRTSHQVTTAPTMKQAEEVMTPIRTALVRSKGPLYKFMTDGDKRATSKANKKLLDATKKGIENNITGSFLEVRPMSIDKLQGLRCPVATVDEWLSGDIKEDVIGALEQGASKFDDYIIIAASSEGTARNGVGDTIKMELMSILKGEYIAPHIGIWWYKLDNIDEISRPDLWIKANPNLGKTVQYDVYQLDVEKAEKVPSARNDIIAKRFGIPMEGFTYYFTYEETKLHPRRKYWGLPCSLGADLSRGDDFCAFTFLFPLAREQYGVKTRCYITEATMAKLTKALRDKYTQFLNEGSLIVMPGVNLNMMEVYEDLDEYIIRCDYDIRSFGYDPYNAYEFVERYEKENGPFGIVKVIQGAKTESVPLGELKHLAEERLLLFDQEIMKFCMGNCIALVDTNGNKKLFKQRNDQKIDSVAAMMDAFVAYKLNIDAYA